MFSEVQEREVRVRPLRSDGLGKGGHEGDRYHAETVYEETFRKTSQYPSVFFDSSCHRENVDFSLS